MRHSMRRPFSKTQTVLLGIFPAILLSFCLLSQSVFALETGDEPIVVRLATESRLQPLYLGKFQNEQAGFDAGYLSKLEEVLSFDLNHNGMTYTTKQTSEIEASIRGPLDQFGQSGDWKAFQALYVVKVQVKDKKLSARVLNVSTGNIKGVEGLILNGDICQDRRIIHKLSDTMYKSLFNSEGIATTRFLYTVKDKDPLGKHSSEVWEADYDGANARQITRDGGYCIQPVYIPPKSGNMPGSFFYVSYKTGQSKIYMASLKDGIGNRFSLLKGNQLMPAISRQRDQVSFISDYTGNPDLFLQKFSPETGAIDKPQQIFSANHAVQGTPTFSPDGKKIAFVSNKDGSTRIYIMDIPAPGASLKDIKPTLITKQNKESSAPVWSPDGKKIAYCAFSKGARQIWVYDIDKRQEIQITQGSGNKENPTWAPNSLHLIFNSTGYGDSELYLVNLNQPEATKISRGRGEKHFPNWQPRF